VSDLAHRVARRYVAAARGAGELLLDDLDPAKVEVYVQGLVDSIDDLDGAEKELGLDLRNMVKLLDEHPHNDDVHHSGETTLEHMRWVLEDVRELSQDKDEQTRQLLGLVALLHDLGKAYTYQLIDGKHTFRKHAELSVKIAEKMLAQLRKQNAKLYSRIIEVVKDHDAFMRLIDAQRAGDGNRRYLNKFMRGALYTSGHLDDLVTFSKADGARAKRMQDTLDGMEAVLADLKTVEKEQRQEAEKQRSRDKPPPEVVGAIRTILESDAPELVPLLPDVKRVNQELGKARRYNVLKRIQRLR